MLQQFKKQYFNLCESVLGYTIRTVDKEPIPVNIDGRDLKITYKTTELIDGNGEIKSIDPILEVIGLIAVDGTEIDDQNVMIKYGDYIRKCVEDSIKSEKDVSKKEAEKNSKVKSQKDDKTVEKDQLTVKTNKID